uniref:Uncharacterized protein n=1 Tax=Anguilla anguilla TaxID=7936 RepID=A0A0E9XHN8_ANGAN
MTLSVPSLWWRLSGCLPPAGGCRCATCPRPPPALGSLDQHNLSRYLYEVTSC